MATVTDLVTEDTIRALARKQGYEAASVCRQVVPDWMVDAGTWYVLSVKRQPGAEWELLGRRRTKAALADLLR